MSSNQENAVIISKQEINKLLDAYAIISNFIEQHIKLEVLYKKEFINGMHETLAEVRKNKTRKVQTFKDFCD